MARLIVKSPYYKCGGNTSLSGYLRYIATRERVELLLDDRPPTRKQEQLINKLTKDFPDSKTLYEYEDYAAKPTKANASALITKVLESNWDSRIMPYREDTDLEESFTDELIDEMLYGGLQNG